jgi:ribosomal protein S30
MEEFTIGISESVFLSANVLLAAIGVGFAIKARLTSQQANQNNSASAAFPPRSERREKYQKRIPKANDDSKAAQLEDEELRAHERSALAAVERERLPERKQRVFRI